VIAVLVGDKNRRERLGGNADSFQALKGIFSTESGINQETGSLGRQQCGVPSTGRREYPTLYDRGLPKIE